MLKNNIKSYSGLLNKCFVLLSFGRSLATKCVSLSNEPSTARPTLIDLNPVKFNYYPFRVSLDKCSGSWRINNIKMGNNELKKGCLIISMT